jgi:O-antigen/teichoic acid export membrane protein
MGVGKSIFRIGRESVILFIAQIIVVCGSLFGIRIMTEYLAPAELGHVFLGLTVGIFANQLLFGPLANGAARFFAPAREMNELGPYTGALLSLFVKAVVATSAIALIAMGFFLYFDPQWAITVGLAFGLAVLSGTSALASNVFNAARKREAVAGIQIADTWLRCGLAALALWLLPKTTETALGAYFVAAMIVVFTTILIGIKEAKAYELKIKDDHEWRRHLLTYSLPFAGWGVFTWAQLASDRWALELFSDSEAVGIYGVAYQLGYTPIAMLTGLAIQVASPILFERVGLADQAPQLVVARRGIWTLTILALVVTMLACTGYMLFGETIIRWFSPEDYHASAPYLPLLALGGGLFGVGQILSIQFLTRLKTLSLARVKIGTALVGIACNLAGAALYGALGVAVAGVIFSLVYLVWAVTLSLKITADPEQK